MKKLLLVGAIALFGAMNAQKNTILVGGNISYNTDKTTNNDSSFKTEQKVDVFSFNPFVGYQFTDNWTAGVKFGVNSSKGTISANGMGYSYNAESKEDTFQYGVFGRYTMPLNETFSVFGELDVFGTSGKSKTPNTSGTPVTYTETKSTGFGVVFTPNLFINFKNSFGLNFNIGGLGYTTTKIKDSDIKNNQFGFSFGQGITVGISKNFGAK